MATPITGDLTKTKVFQTSAAALQFDVVCVEDLGNASAAINQAYLSGKQAGAGFVGKDFVLYIAEGDKPTDKWISQLEAVGNITPVHTTDATDPVEADGDECLVP